MITGSPVGDIANVLRKIITAKENSPKSVDENDELIIVYHGINAENLMNPILIIQSELLKIIIKKLDDELLNIAFGANQIKLNQPQITYERLMQNTVKG